MEYLLLFFEYNIAVCRTLITIKPHIKLCLLLLLITMQFG